MCPKKEAYKKIEEIFEKENMKGVEGYISKLPQEEKELYTNILGIFKNELDKAYWGQVRP